MRLRYLAPQLLDHQSRCQPSPLKALTISLPPGTTNIAFLTLNLARNCRTAMQLVLCLLLGPHANPQVTDMLLRFPIWELKHLGNGHPVTAPLPAAITWPNSPSNCLVALLTMEKLMCRYFGELRGLYGWD